MKVTILPFETAKTKVCFLFYCTGHSFLCGATWARLVVRSACVHSELSCARFFFLNCMKDLLFTRKKKRNKELSQDRFLSACLWTERQAWQLNLSFSVCAHDRAAESPLGETGKKKWKGKKKQKLEQRSGLRREAEEAIAKDDCFFI